MENINEMKYKEIKNHEYKIKISSRRNLMNPKNTEIKWSVNGKHQTTYNSFNKIRNIESND